MASPQLLSLLTGIAAGLSVLAAVEMARSRVSLGAWLALELEPVRKTFSEGRIPTLKEKIRLAVLFGLLGTAAGWLIGGLVLAVAAAAFAPFVTGVGLATSGARYRRRIERSLPDVARAVADGLAAGRSPRGALGSVHRSLGGEAGREFARIGAEIALGLPTAVVMDQLADRLDSSRIDAFAVAVTSHRTTGGDLASLLRRFADGATEQDRISDDARSSTAQARFSGYLVAAMPLAAGLLVELVSPGLVRSVAGSPAALALVAVSLIIQTGGFVAIGRLASVSGE